MGKKNRRPAPRRVADFVRYRAGELALRGLVGVLPHLPQRLIGVSTCWLARAAYVSLWRYRRRMRENIEAAYADRLSAKEKEILLWSAWLNFARGVLDTIRVMHLSKEHIVDLVDLEGEEHIRRGLEKGKGVLALSAHLGSFTLIGARLAAGGYPFSVVVKQPTDERVAALLDRYRSRVGIETISAKPRRDAARKVLKALRANRIVLLIADEFKGGEVHVDFFGIKAPAPRGPATLALRTEAVTLPMFVIRQSDDRLLLKVDDPLAPVVRPDVEESVAATTALFTAHIEAAIRKHPEEWNWLGLPHNDGKPSRAEIKRQRRELRRAGLLPPRRKGARSSTPQT
jgi:KDO2-lipid IV(A) lauroyltransferase